MAHALSLAPRAGRRIHRRASAGRDGTDAQICSYETEKNRRGRAEQGNATEEERTEQSRSSITVSDYPDGNGSPTTRLSEALELSNGGKYLRNKSSTGVDDARKEEQQGG